MHHLAPLVRYRLHLYDGRHELLADRHHHTHLDLTRAGYEHSLALWLQALTRAALAAGETVTAPRLEVRVADTGVRVLDWPGV